jgi:hypothetical protein
MWDDLYPHQRAALDTAVINAVFAVYIKPLEEIIGYHPQRLLVDHRPLEQKIESYWRDWADIRREYDPRRKGPVAVVTITETGEDLDHRIQAALADKAVRVILLDVETHRGRSIDIPGRYDFAAMIERHEIRGKEARLKPPPPYLQHDPSKKGYGRGRRR